MSRLFALITLLIAFFSLSPLTAAQEDTGWPVIERCVGEPTTPPDDWMFEGTIFTQETVHYFDDIGGLHAIRSDVSRPYFVASNGRDILVAGALSSDGRWFAVPAGQNQTRSQGLGIASVGWNSEAIHIYSTDPSRQMISLESDSTIGSFGIEVWLDNEHFVYSGYDPLTDEFNAFIVNPFTQVIEPFEDTIPRDDTHQTLIETLQSMFGSSYTVGKVQIAPNTQAVALRVGLTEKPYSERFLVADVEEQIIVDLCITSPPNPESFISGFAWSPGSRHLALSQDGWIRIFDTETWSLYNIFQHSSYVVDWLEGWSSAD